MTCKNCEATFEKTARGQRYCSRRCRRLIQHRKWRLRPNGKAMQRAQNARYYLLHTKAKRAANRAAGRPR